MKVDQEIQAIRRAALLPKEIREEANSLMTDPTKHTKFIDVIEHSDDKFRSGVVDALLQRGGVKKIDRQNPFLTVCRRPDELVKECLYRKCIPHRRDDPFLFFRALERTDLPNILRDVANVSVLKGFEEAEERHLEFSTTATVPDFKPATIAQVFVPDLDEVDGEFKQSKLDDERYLSLTALMEPPMIALKEPL